MAKFGAFCFPATGHINPMAALARSLQLKGHQVVLFGIPDTEDRVRAAGIDFHCIGAQDYPPGELTRLDERMARLHGVAALRFTLQRVTDSARMVLRDAPQAVRAEGIDALLVDQADFAGNVADHLGLPWISIALLPPFLLDDRFPPFWFGWAAGEAPLLRLRNRIAFEVLRRMASPIFREVNRQRKAWGLKPQRHPVEALSPLAQITQLPEVLEFPIHGSRPPELFYTGPFVHPQQRPPIDFPWERLDGRPLIYASLGTFQNGSQALFRIIAEACAGLDAQLAISLGGGLRPEQLGPLPGAPLVVRFAPQLEILQRASLVITHAGINTVLESLSEGVPLVAMPLGNDQPGVAARLRARGAGAVVSRHRLTPARLRKAIALVLYERRFRDSARQLQQAIRQSNGAARAAELIEEVLQLRPA
jgi:zeaxanthin glucosyltransferase